MNKRGYSLVEIIVAAVIFSVSIASVFASVSSFRIPVEDSTRQLRAAQLSKKILEGLRQKVADPMATNPDLSNGQHGTSGAPSVDAEFPAYQYWYTVSNVAGSNVLKVDITVRTPP